MHSIACPRGASVLLKQLWSPLYLKGLYFALPQKLGVSIASMSSVVQGNSEEDTVFQRNHRKIGSKQELFFFHPLSPGSAFWYPKGAHIYNKLIEFLRREYRKRGFYEVITPNIYNCKLWQISGHWDHYRDNMYRNEMSGSITGLTRVRRFQQDDAHIFCRREQLIEEIKLWNEAEDVLKAALNESGKTWKLSEGDGAFYGPKIDVTVEDSLGRSHQCGTVQLDFQQPQRFDLIYFDECGEKQRPVMIHRAILGSLERFIAILLENYNGKLPFWLSPRQAKLIAIHESVREYAQEIKHLLYSEGFEVEFDDCFSDTIERQIRKAIQAQFNFVLVVGSREVKNRAVNVRTRDNEIIGEISLEELISAFRRLDVEYIRGRECEVFVHCANT